jgi:hypothetical protein
MPLMIAAKLLGGMEGRERRFIGLGWEADFKPVLGIVFAEGRDVRDNTGRGNRGFVGLSFGDYLLWFEWIVTGHRFLKS